MFTGIVEEVGAFWAAMTTAATCACASRRRACSTTRHRRLDRRVRLLPDVVAHDADGLRGRALEGDDRQDRAALVGRRHRQPRARHARSATASAATSSRATSAAPARSRDRRQPGAHVVTVRAPDAFARYLVPKGSITVDGVSMTVVDVGGPGGSATTSTPPTFTLWLIPHTLARHHARRAARGRPRQPRARRARQARRAAARSSGRCPMAPAGGGRHARGDPTARPGRPARDRPRAARRAARRPPDHRRRRRGPRERGRPRLRRRARHPRAAGVHDPPHRRHRLPRHARRSRRSPRAAADGRAQHVAARDGLHRLDRGRRGHQHRHLGRRPRPHDPPGGASPTPRAADSRGPATSSRCARASGGVLRRAGHTEAAVDLCRLAGLQPVARSARSCTTTAA
jgi:hypothetical protein